MLDLAPVATAGEGAFAVAGRWFLRRFGDGLVRRAPTAERLRFEIGA